MWQHVHKSTLLAVQKGLREVNYHSLKQVFGHFLHRHYALKVDRLSEQQQQAIPLK